MSRGFVFFAATTESVFLYAYKIALVTESIGAIDVEVNRTSCK